MPLTLRIRTLEGLRFRPKTDIESPSFEVPSPCMPRKPGSSSAKQENFEESSEEKQFEEMEKGETRV